MKHYETLPKRETNKIRDLYLNTPRKKQTIGELWYSYQDFMEMKLKGRSKRQEGYLDKLIRENNE